MPLSFFNETVDRYRPGEKTSRGSTVPDWSNATKATISGCHVQPSSTTLSQDGRVSGISDSFSLYAPAGADIETGDKVIYEGKSFLVTGVPRPWKSPTGRVSNLQVTLERWSG